MALRRQRHPGGAEAERQAVAWLRRQQVKPVQTNFNCKAGEIDFIGIDGEHLVFFEIRYRAPGVHGTAAETIDAGKQRKLIKAATYFLHSVPAYNNMPCRFDAVVSDECDSRGNYRFEWLKNAFGAD